MGVYEAIYRFLDTNGDGTGTNSAVGNYSLTPQEFYFEATATTSIHRLIIHIEDTGGMQAEEYGNLGGPLANGYSLLVQNEDGTTVLDLTDGVPITSNAGLGRYCYDVEAKQWGAGDDMMQARWTFDKAGEPLHLQPGYRLTITFNDDLTGLIEHRFMVQGYGG